jgi:hypothetical protein
MGKNDLAAGGEPLEVVTCSVISFDVLKGIADWTVGPFQMRGLATDDGSC